MSSPPYFRYVFAGGEGMYTTMEENNVQFVLTSYFFLRNKGERTRQRLLKSFSPVFLDSGAFSYNQVVAQEGIKWRDLPKDPRVQQYVKDYGEFVRKHGSDYWVCANVDVGKYQDKEKNQKYLEEYTGQYIMPVIHPDDPLEWVDRVFREYPMVALGGVGSERDESKIMRYCKNRLAHARRYGTKLHGFALTSIELMRMCPFYTVDSTSWLAGAKYGITYWFDSRRLRMWDKYNKHIRRRFKLEVKELGIDWDRYMADHSRAVNGWNIQQWKQFTEFLSEVGWKKNQVYWEEGEEWLEMLAEKRRNMQKSKIYLIH